MPCIVWHTQAQDLVNLLCQETGLSKPRAYASVRCVCPHNSMRCLASSRTQLHTHLCTSTHTHTFVHAYTQLHTRAYTRAGLKAARAGGADWKGMVRNHSASGWYTHMYMLTHTHSHTLMPHMQPLHTVAHHMLTHTLTHMPHMQPLHTVAHQCSAYKP